MRPTRTDLRLEPGRAIPSIVIEITLSFLLSIACLTACLSMAVWTLIRESRGLAVAVAG